MQEQELFDLCVEFIKKSGIQYMKLSEVALFEFAEYFSIDDWKYISTSIKVSESFIRKFKANLDWYYISSHQTLSEDFIREFKDKVDWHNISWCQTLSENFIREFKDKVDWYYIALNQKSVLSGQRYMLSDEFMREFQDKMVQAEQ